MMRFLVKQSSAIGVLGLLLAASISFTACKKEEKGDGAPPQPKVVNVPDMNLITVDQDK